MKKRIVILMTLLLLVFAGCSSKKDPVVQTVSGIVSDATMNTLQIETAEGNLYNFSIQDVEIVAGENGLLIGAEVEVSYYGELEASVMNEAVKIVVTKDPEPESGSDDIVELVGMISAKDDDTISVELDDGLVFRFVTTDVAIEGAEELLIGAEVKVYYSGLLNSRQEIQDVEIQKIEVLEDHGIMPLGDDN